MLDNLSKYVYEVYRQKSVSKAAKKLYISQPALSASIKKAEQELGTPIFNRNTIPFSLTPEGRIYINAIEKVIHIEEETKSSILDISEIKSGTLTIGTATHMSLYAIPIICESFLKKYPHIDINIVSSASNELLELLDKKQVDLIFTSSDENLGGFIAEPLFEERFLIAIRKDYPNTEHLAPLSLSYSEVVERKYSENSQVSDLSIFDGIEFIYSPPNTSLYKKRKLFFGEAGLSHHITTNQGRQQLNYNLMCAGFGALFTTDSAIATMAPNSNCRFFVLKNPNGIRSFSVAHRTESDAAAFRIIEEFTKVARETFNTDMPLKRLSLNHQFSERK